MVTTTKATTAPMTMEVTTTTAMTAMDMVMMTTTTMDMAMTTANDDLRGKAQVGEAVLRCDAEVDGVNAAPKDRAHMVNHE